MLRELILIFFVALNLNRPAGLIHDLELDLDSKISPNYESMINLIPNSKLALSHTTVYRYIELTLIINLSSQFELDS